MRKIYLLRSKRVDGRVEVYPLPFQHTISSEAGHTRETVDIDVERRIQASNDARHIYVTNPSGTVYFTVRNGNTPFASRLPVYSRGDEKVYRIDNIRKLSDLDPDNADDRQIIETVAAHCRALSAEQLTASGLSDWYSSHRSGDEGDGTATAESDSATVQRIREAVSRGESGGSSEGTAHYGVNGRLIASLGKIRAVMAYLRDCGNNALAVNQKALLLSELIDLMHNGVIKFMFRKQNGDIRVAYGTLERSVIDYVGESAPAQTARPEGDSPEDGAHIFYFDIQKKGWRCFCTEDFRTHDRGDSLFVDTTSLNEAQRMRIDSIVASSVSTV